MQTIKEKKDRFRAWQKHPHQVAPLVEENHVCPTCGTRYQGNFCPRCGQSAKVAGRYSFKKAFLLFIDVWGLGNRGMFRTLRDLVLRPGYMIRDYLDGMQMAYFPPFKMFFLLIALSLLIDSGLNIRGVNTMKENKARFEQGFSRSQEKTDSTFARSWNDTGTDDEVELGKLTPGEKVKERLAEEKKKRVVQKVKRFLTEDFYEWFYKNLTFILLAGLLVLSGPLYLMFRHCPTIPDMRYSEFFVVMLYTTNMLLVYSCVAAVFRLEEEVSPAIWLLALIPLKQFSGYGVWQTTWRAATGFFIFCAIALLLVIMVGIAAGYYFSIID